MKLNLIYLSLALLFAGCVPTQQSSGASPACIPPASLTRSGQGILEFTSDRGEGGIYRSGERASIRARLEREGLGRILLIPPGQPSPVLLSEGSGTTSFGLDFTFSQPLGVYRFRLEYRASASAPVSAQYETWVCATN